MSHYYSEKQTSRINIKKINVSVKGISFDIYTGSGIFSKDRLDNGSKVLIENAIIREKWKILDLGCGNGIVGVSIKLLYPETDVMLVDINRRAVKLCRKNIKLHDLKNTTAKNSNVYSNVQDKFNTVLLNPPQTVGKKICFQMINETKEHLVEGGLLQIVARHKKGGSSLEQEMERVFGNVEQITKQSGYRVYVSKN